jgi:hypothetical protein
MASVLEPVAFDPAIFRTELKEFEGLLKSRPDLSERDDILPFFKQRKHLTAYIGTLSLNIPVATEVCFEFDITGNFRADVLLGSKAAGQFCVVEFEPGEQDAIFKKQDRKNPEWSTRFEHAFSQIVDWFWALEDERNTVDFRTTFGDGEIVFSSLLVMGRTAGLDEAKKRRMAWRTKKVLIDSNKVACITFDQLHAALREKFEFYAVAAEVVPSSTGSGLPPPPAPPSPPTAGPSGTPSQPS